MNEPQIIIYKGKTYWGYKKCPTWLKNKFKQVVDYTCEDCGVKETVDNILEIHRPKRGAEGGLYMVVPKNHPLSNSKVVCNKCHKKYNYSRKLNYSTKV